MPTATPLRGRGGGLLAVLLTGQAMATMDSSIVAVAIPVIRQDLAASDAAIQLLSAGYLFAFAVTVVTGARLGDRYGHRRVFRLGLAAFTAASLACGLAPDPVTLVVARLVQGVAGAVMVPQVLSLIQRSFTGARQARAVSVYSMVLALGVAAGMLTGGLVVGLDLFGWSWRPAFLVNLPVGVGLLVASGRHLPQDLPGDRPRMDPVGVAALSMAIAAVVAPLVVGRDQGWPVVASAAVLVAGVLGLDGFRRYERWLARRGGAPLVELAILRRPGVRTGLLVCCLVMGCYAVFAFTMALHLQSGLGFDPMAAGLAFLPYPAGFAAVSLAAPRVAARLRARLPVAGPLVFAGAMGLLAAVTAGGGWPVAATVPLLFAGGAGHAAGFSPLFARVMARVDPAHSATLSGMASTGTLLAGVMAIATVGSVYFVAGGTGTAASAEGLAAVLLILVAILAATAGLTARAVAALSAAEPVAAEATAAEPAPAESTAAEAVEADRAPVAGGRP